MQRISVAEAKNRLSELIARAETGEIIDVTRHGKPVARLVPIDDAGDAAPQRTRVQAAFRHLTALRQGIRLDGDLKAIARDGLD